MKDWFYLDKSMIMFGKFQVTASLAGKIIILRRIVVWITMISAENSKFGQQVPNHLNFCKERCC